MSNLCRESSVKGMQLAIAAGLIIASQVAGQTSAPTTQSGEPPKVTVKVVQGGESHTPAERCRGVIVGPGVNQPDPFPGYGGFVGWESPIRLRDGNWLVGFSAGYWHGSPPTPLRGSASAFEAHYKMGMPKIDAPRGGRAMLTRSADAGKTWSKPETIIDTPADDRHPFLLELKDGTLLCGMFTLFALGDIRKDSIPPYRTVMVRSKDKGKTWEQLPPLPSPFIADESDGPMILARDGSINLVISGAPREKQPDQAALLCSRDAGESWQVVGVVRAKHDLYEVAAAELPDGRWVMIVGPGDPGGADLLRPSLDHTAHE